MPTQRPLRDMIPDLVQHISNHRSTLQFNFRLYKIDEGQIREEVEQSLKEEMISVSAYNRAIKRIPSINIPKKTTDKLSKVYSTPPVRKTSDKDTELVDTISKVSDIDNVMHFSNRYYNLQKMSAIEFYAKDGKQKMRVLAGHQYLPYSDDPVDPLNMTVFIKFMGSEKIWGPAFDHYGRKVSNQGEPKQIDVFHVYSDDEFLVLDNEGNIHLDKMTEMDRADGVNPAGVIPFVHFSHSALELIPYPNKTALDIAILIPKLLTDLNYAAQFMSHSLIYTRNTDLKGAEVAPDAILNLGDTDPTGGVPEIGTITPQVAIENVLQLIEFEMSAYFASIGIKAATQGSMMPGREASGFAKAMDEGDVTSERKVQVEAYKIFERKVWDRLAKMQAYWSRANLVNEKRTFSPDFIENFSVVFGDMKHLVSNNEKVDRVKAMRDLKLISRKQALKFLEPDLTDEQIQERLDEIDEETEENTTDFAVPNQSQFNGQTEVGEEEDEVGPNKDK
jgi:hypothetical protein